MCVRFTSQDVYWAPSESQPDPRAGGWGWPTAQPPKRVKPNLVAFRADGVLYRRDKEGLYTVQK